MKHKLDFDRLELLRGECDELNQMFREEFNRINIPLGRKPLSLKVLQVSIPLLVILNVLAFLKAIRNALLFDSNEFTSCCKSILLFLLLYEGNNKKERQIIQLKFELLRKSQAGKIKKTTSSE